MPLLPTPTHYWCYVQKRWVSSIFCVVSQFVNNNSPYYVFFAPLYCDWLHLLSRPEFAWFDSPEAPHFYPLFAENKETVSLFHFSSSFTVFIQQFTLSRIFCTTTLQSSTSPLPPVICLIWCLQSLTSTHYWQNLENSEFVLFLMKFHSFLPDKSYYHVCFTPCNCNQTHLLSCLHSVWSDTSDPLCLPITCRI